MERNEISGSSATLYRFPATAAERAALRRGRPAVAEWRPQTPVIMPETGWYHDEAVKDGKVQ